MKFGGYREKPQTYLEYKQNSFKSYKTEANELIAKISGSSLSNADKMALLNEIKIIFNQDILC